REVGKYRRQLERAHDAAACHLRGLLERDVLAAIDDLAAARDHELGEKIEEGGLAGAVRADERVDVAAAHPEVDAAHGNETAELLGESAGLEQEIVGGGRGCHGGLFL